MRIWTVLDFIEKIPKPYLSFFGYLLVLVIGSLDTVTSYNTSLSLLYLLPIVLIAWFEGGVPSVIISIFSAITWAVSDLVSGHAYSHINVPIWNSVMVLAMFLIVAYSITAIKKLLMKERERAGTDDLTGASNIKAFFERARLEVSRSATHKRPLTLAYINIDNLKHVNDTLGHIAGDYLLHEVAQIMKSTLRPTDIISRLGGAKFAILMPETENESAAGIINKVQKNLRDMVEKNGWTVIFSTGVVSRIGATCTIDELIKMAEDLTNRYQGSR
jgi:diguanylate cyclase (GGDEF)-like protein